jgi:hypothetical protein
MPTPFHTGPAQANTSLGDRIDAVITAAVTAEMAWYGAARAGRRLPPLSWVRAADGTMVGYVDAERPESALRSALEPWARTLHLTQQPTALSPMADSLAYTGIVEQTKVRVWGLTDSAASGDTAKPPRWSR